MNKYEHGRREVYILISVVALLSRLDSHFSYGALLKTLKRHHYSTSIFASSHSNPSLLGSSYEGYSKQICKFQEFPRNHKEIPNKSGNHRRESIRGLHPHLCRGLPERVVIWYFTTFLLRFTTFLVIFTNINLDVPSRTVSRGSRGPSQGSPGPLRSVLRRFEKVRGSQRKLEKVRESSRRLDKIRESSRRLEKVRES